MAGIDSVAKSSARFKDETDLKAVLAKDFSIEPEASLANRALAAAFVVAWRAAHDFIPGPRRHWTHHFRSKSMLLRQS